MSYQRIAQALTTNRFSYEACLERLEKFKSSSEMFRDIKPVHELCEALKIESPETIGDVLAVILETSPWHKLKERPATEPFRRLWIVSHFVESTDEKPLLTVVHRDLIVLANLADEIDQALVSDLIDWLEFGNKEALTRLVSRMSKERTDLRTSLRSPPRIKARIWKLLHAVHHSDAAFLKLLRDNFGGCFGIVGSASAWLARQRDVLGVDEGANCASGGRTDLYPFEGRSLLKTAFALERDVFYDIVVDVLKSPWNRESQPKIWMLDFLDWQDDQEVRSELGYCRSKLFDRLVVTWSGKPGKGGRVHTKVFKDTKSARRGFTKGLRTQSEKLDEEPSPPVLDIDDLDEALDTAIRACSRSEIPTLVKAGATLKNRDSQFVRCREDPEIIRLALELGMEGDAKTEHGITLLDQIANDARCQQWQIDSARYLLETGARGSSWRGMSPLHYAAKHGNTGLVRLLLEYGFSPADPAGAAANEDANKTAPQIALAHGHAYAGHILLNAH